MSKFKVGDKVKNVSDTSVDICVGHVYEVRDIVGDRTIAFNDDKGSRRHRLARDYELAEKTWDTLAVGDITLDDDEIERKVLAVLPGVVLMDKTFGGAGAWWTCSELERMGWTIKQDSPTADTTELSVAELEKKLGIASGTLRVKKD